MPRRLAAPALLLLALGACARTPPVEVTRFNLGAPIERGTVSVQPVDGAEARSLSYQTYERAVAGELQRLGYVEGAPTAALYVARVDVESGTRAALAERSPVQIGIGGGTGGFRGGGVGLGASFGLGGGGSRSVTMTELRVQMTRRSDATVVWEGRAQLEARSGTESANSGVAAARLAEALFRDFPGRNGEVVTVR